MKALYCMKIIVKNLKKFNTLKIKFSLYFYNTIGEERKYMTRYKEVGAAQKKRINFMK